jgi:hypothetical protein
VLLDVAQRAVIANNCASVRNAPKWLSAFPQIPYLRRRATLAVRDSPGGGAGDDQAADSVSPRWRSCRSARRRTAILSLQHFAEQTSDDAELAAVHKCIAQLQQILAEHSKDREAAMGMTPAMRTVKRASANY